jgi:hypothetical protein
MISRKGWPSAPWPPFSRGPLHNGHAGFGMVEQLGNHQAIGSETEKLGRKGSPQVVQSPRLYHLRAQLHAFEPRPYSNPPERQSHSTAGSPSRREK